MFGGPVQEAGPGAARGGLHAQGGEEGRGWRGHRAPPQLGAGGGRPPPDAEHLPCRLLALVVGWARVPESRFAQPGFHAGRKPRVVFFCLNVHTGHWRETPLFRHWRKYPRLSFASGWRKRYRCFRWPETYSKARARAGPALHANGTSPGNGEEPEARI